MSRIAVVGAGMAGLAAALFCARRGHEVTLLERDAAAPPDGAGADRWFTDWHRPGLPQGRHSHKFLARSCRVLAEEAPDVLDDLVAAGAVRVPVSRLHTGPPPVDEFALAARRLMHEAVLRRAVGREPTVRLRPGATARALVTGHPDGGVPTVDGVRLDSGEVVSADLVVDAAGRHARLLDSIDVRRPPALVHPCGFVYLTRHYRLRPGAELPPLDRPLAMSLGYAATLAFPADNGTFSLSVTLSDQDELRHALRRPATWDRFIAAVPHTHRWARRGVPQGPVRTMSGIANRWQRMHDDDGPALAGLVLLGDAALQTNPTYGRGVSIAFLHAQQLARTLDTAGDPGSAAFTDAFEAWTARNLGVWYRTQVTADTAGLRRMAAGLRGQPPPVSDDPFARFMAGMEVLAGRDEVVARALGRMAHLLITPAQLLGDRDVVRRVTGFLDGRTVTDDAVEGPARREFEAIVAA
ncbi:FAD-dependent oxidoreductase [Micromonospora sp. ANENR4]|uniref:FAD-dependent oxidoreductase n=1 Tax=Micromonospora sp. ANENR4 TaxID=2783662 RepID=UPI0018901CE7|nr:FAD-dependent oxidoreductase [Micromonospora sp. ANENR4]